MNHFDLMNSGKRGIAIFGWGRGASSLIDYLNASGVYQPVTLVGKTRKELGKSVNGLSVGSYDGQYRGVGIGCVISVRDPKLRIKIYKNNPQIAHWTILSFTNQATYGMMLGEGSVVGPGSSINSSSKIGRHCFIEKNTHIGVDVLIGDFCMIDTSCTISHGVQIGNGVFIGPGSIIAQDVKIGDGAVIETGSVITQDVKAGEFGESR